MIKGEIIQEGSDDVLICVRNSKDKEVVLASVEVVKSVDEFFISFEIRFKDRTLLEKVFHNVEGKLGNELVPFNFNTYGNTDKK